MKLIPSKYSFRLVRAETVLSISKKTNKVGPLSVKTTLDEKSISDKRRRLFLKALGAIGLGALGVSMFPKKASALVMGGTPSTSVVGIKDFTNARINPAKEDGNLASIKTSTDNLSGIKTSTDPLVAAGAGGYIRQDSTATIAKETDGNLATIATNIPAKGQALMAASTPVVIASNQTAIPITGTVSGGVDPVGLKDTTSTQINPSTDDSILYLRRMVKLMESQATVDAGNRQRVTIDMLPGNVATLPTYTAAATLPTVTTVGTVTVANNLLALAGWNQQMFQDVARNAYANGIRNNLSFS